MPEDEARRLLWLARMLEEAHELERATLAWPAPSAEQPAVILYTGGTTGEAKSVAAGVGGGREGTEGGLRL